jgi:hypothetical protein
LSCKIILHAGTEKTGTTSLQVFMERRRDELKSLGYFYPHTGENYEETGRFPKHKWLINALMSGEGSTLFANIQAILSECTPDTRAIILSDEALFGDWAHASDAGRAALRSLSRIFEVEVWVWFREPVAYARSMYIQMLKNPRGPAAGNGYDLPIEDAIELPWFSRRLDYIRYIRDVESVLGPGRVKPFLYKGDIIDDMLDALGADGVRRDGLAENRTVGAAGVDMLRTLNRFDLGEEDKRRAVSLIGQLEELVKAQSRPLALAPATQDRIRQLAAPSVEALKREFGISFTDADPEAWTLDAVQLPWVSDASPPTHGPSPEAGLFAPRGRHPDDGGSEAPRSHRRRSSWVWRFVAP